MLEQLVPPSHQDYFTAAPPLLPVQFPRGKEGLLVSTTITDVVFSSLCCDLDVFCLVNF